MYMLMVQSFVVFFYCFRHLRNQNHRLSRWFALRVQPFVTGQRYSALKRLPFSPLFLAAAKAAYFSFYLLPDYFLLASFRRLTRKRVK